VSQPLAVPYHGMIDGSSPVRPHIATASQACECTAKALIDSLISQPSLLRRLAAMSTMITFAANNEFFRKRKRA
jgi:hypothetical protein